MRLLVDEVPAIVVRSIASLPQTVLMLCSSCANALESPLRWLQKNCKSLLARPGQSSVNSPTKTAKRVLRVRLCQASPAQEVATFHYSHLIELLCTKVSVLHTLADVVCQTTYTMDNPVHAHRVVSVPGLSFLPPTN